MIVAMTYLCTRKFTSFHRNQFRLLTVPLHWYGTINFFLNAPYNGAWAELKFLSYARLYVDLYNDSDND